MQSRLNSTPSATGAAEPVRDLLYKIRDYFDLNSRPENDLARKYSQQISEVLATPPVRGDREILRTIYARAICEADGHDYDAERKRAADFEQGAGSAREIINRAHRYADAVLPVQPGGPLTAGEEHLLRTLMDGTAAELHQPAEIALINLGLAERCDPRRIRITDAGRARWRVLHNEDLRGGAPA